MFEIYVSDLTKQLNPIVKEWQHKYLSETSFLFVMIDVFSKRCCIALRIIQKKTVRIVNFFAFFENL